MARAPAGVCVCVCVCVCARVYVCVNNFPHVCAHTCVCAHKHMCVRVCLRRRLKGLRDVMQMQGVAHDTWHVKRDSRFRKEQTECVHTDRMFPHRPLKPKP